LTVLSAAIRLYRVSARTRPDVLATCGNPNLSLFEALPDDPPTRMRDKSPGVSSA